MLGCVGDNDDESVGGACRTYCQRGVLSICPSLKGGRETNQVTCTAVNSTWNGTACANTDYTTKKACETGGVWWGTSLNISVGE
jgi:hypothetical protein